MRVALLPLLAVIIGVYSYQYCYCCYCVPGSVSCLDVHALFTINPDISEVNNHRIGQRDPTFQPAPGTNYEDHFVIDGGNISVSLIDTGWLHKYPSSCLRYGSDAWLITANGSAVNSMENYIYPGERFFSYKEESGKTWLQINGTEPWHVCLDDKSIYAAGNVSGCSNLVDVRIEARNGTEYAGPSSTTSSLINTAYFSETSQNALSSTIQSVQPTSTSSSYVKYS